MVVVFDLVAWGQSKIVVVVGNSGARELGDKGSTIGQGEFNRIAFPNPDTFLQNKYHVSDSYWPSPHSRKPHCTPYPYTTEKTNNSSISIFSLEKYNLKGEIDYERALHAEAAVRGKAISKRFHVICFEDIRPYTGWLHRNDSKASIANGVTPEGFIGNAVNMVDLDINYLQIMTASVLFNLFKKLQVYETRESMVAARTCIEDGAVSLDGGILSENGILSLEILAQIEEKKSDLRMIEERNKGLEQDHAKNIKKFNKKKETYEKFTDRMKPMTELLLYF
ncbi:Protein DEFECTIVE IN MERISTEM SILENCING 3 [Glycine max]|nr:Protein DEFECTIVE IN MERISTEM SILENCING 3 [Glycine max]